MSKINAFVASFCGTGVYLGIRTDDPIFTFCMIFLTFMNTFLAFDKS